MQKKKKVSKISPAMATSCMYLSSAKKADAPQNSQYLDKDIAVTKTSSKTTYTY